MEDKLSRSIAIRFKIFGIYQIAGGIIGLVLLINLILSLGYFNVLTVIAGIAGVFAFTYSIIAGALLIKIRERGLLYSIVNQCLQLVGFILFGCYYKYGSGFQAFIGIRWGESFIFSFNYGISTWNFYLFGKFRHDYVEINLVAACVLGALYKIKKDIKAKKEYDDIERIGEEK
jgi:hypothetical protein